MEDHILYSVCVIVFSLLAVKCCLIYVRDVVTFEGKYKWHVSVCPARLRRMQEKVTSKSPSLHSTPPRRRSRSRKRERKWSAQRTTPPRNNTWLQAKVKSSTYAEKPPALSPPCSSAQIQSRNVLVCKSPLTAHLVHSWQMITARRVSTSTPTQMTRTLWNQTWTHKGSCACPKLWVATDLVGGLTSEGWAWTAGKMQFCFQTAHTTRLIDLPLCISVSILEMTTH